nr:hypothetical protein [uncultured Eubacterium sp.]
MPELWDLCTKMSKKSY